MNADLQKTVTTAATNAVIDALAAQPWWKRYANTVTTAAGGLVTLGTWALTTELGLPRPVQIALGVMVLVASVVASRATKNGVTPRGNTDVLGAVIPAVTEAVRPGAGSLDRLVQDKAAEAANAVTEQITQAATHVITGAPDAAAKVAAVVSEAERAFLGRS
ncbi:hypothetical protein [Mycobacteroides chelonae]|uniref:hypothetical protein n=1 Tax=Mycobacteroides chelonae TaxID=1774 RepID=UPI000994627B|nr:hypothetical protein [Mycobacteroides chelonae]